MPDAAQTFKLLSAVSMVASKAARRVGVYAGATLGSRESVEVSFMLLQSQKNSISGLVGLF